MEASSDSPARPPRKPRPNPFTEDEDSQILEIAHALRGNSSYAMKQFLQAGRDRRFGRLWLEHPADEGEPPEAKYRMGRRAN